MNKMDNFQRKIWSCLCSFGVFANSFRLSAVRTGKSIFQYLRKWESVVKSCKLYIRYALRLSCFTHIHAVIVPHPRSLLGCFYNADSSRALLSLDCRGCVENFSLFASENLLYSISTKLLLSSREKRFSLKIFLRRLRSLLKKTFICYLF